LGSARRALPRGRGLVSNGNYLISGGNASGMASFNNLLVADFDADLEKLAHIPGASLGAALLRFDGTDPIGKPASSPVTTA
jgi:carbohydrate-selective porin OprB